MKLYFSHNSPFARIARIAARENGAMQMVEELPSANRQPDNPVLEHSPVGRVPTLVDGTTVITEAKNVVRYIAAKSARYTAEPSLAEGWQELMQEGQILGFVDGIANWIRENRREPKHRSSVLIEVEQDRSERCLDYFEKEAVSERLGEFPVFRFIALAAGLDLMDFHQFKPSWRTDCPTLASWFKVQKSRTSMQETEPR